MQGQQLKIKINKLLDISYNILYTWTAAGDGGIYYREELVGGTHPRAARALISACGRDPPGGEALKKKISEYPLTVLKP